LRKLLVILLVMLCLPACVKYEEDRARDAAFDNADRFFHENRYSEAITAYDAIAKDSSGSDLGAQALYASAFAQAYYDNPHKDYARALQEFDEFLRVYPKNRKADDARSWQFILKTTLDIKKENERLLRNIEALKKIDIRHEERRRK
jgi:outer membrane protein assembly factor BamD (BamD/ComL family)